MPTQEGPLLPFANFAPDVATIESTVSGFAQNVLPRADGWGPLPSPVAISKALGAPVLPGGTKCRGAFVARNQDGSITLFAASDTNLYQLNNTDFSWTNVSAGGIPYAAVPPQDNWQFVQFLNIVYAVQANVTLQVFTLQSSTQFATITPAGGSPLPPPATHIAVINGFIVLSGLVGNPNRVQWSDLDNPTIWTNTLGAGLSDFQDLPDGGVVHDIRGGDQYGIIFQDTAIRSMTFAPGSPVVFVILRIATQDGIFGQYSSITAGDNIYFCSPQGFKVIQSGGYPTPIGKEQVDRTFFNQIDSTNFQLFIAATDPTSTRVYWIYKSLGGQKGLADQILIYDWALQRWSSADSVELEYIIYMGKPQTTLEGLDSVAPGIITISAAANGGTYSGNPSIRLTVSALSVGTPPSNTDLGGDVGFFTINAASWSAGLATFTTTAAHGLAVGVPVSIANVNPAGYNDNGAYITLAGTTGSTIVVALATNPGAYVSGGTVTNRNENTIEIYSVTGGVPAGNFNFVIVDATHIDILGQTFTATGTGQFGGSLDQLGFSLDAVTTTALQSIAAFDDSHMLNFFNGLPLQAIVETAEHDLEDRVFVSKLRPITDASSTFGSLAFRDVPFVLPSYTGESSINAYGTIPVRKETRYARARIRIPAGTIWSYITGVYAPEAQPEQGDR